MDINNPLFYDKKDVHLEIISDTHFRNVTIKDMINNLNQYIKRKSIYLKNYLKDSNVKTIINNGKIIEKRTVSRDSYKILCASGDICSMEQLIPFLNFVINCYDHVFFIPGNHEYYYNDMDQVNSFLIKVNNMYNNLTIFTPDITHIFLFNDLIIFGATLWTYVKDKFKDKVLKSNTYNKIKKNGSKLKIEDTNKLHKESVSKLTELMSYNIPIIVMTHHQPSLECASLDYTGYHSSHVTDLDEIIKYPLITWIYGHSHCDVITYVNNVLLVSNQWGEPNNIQKMTLLYYI